MDKDKVDDRWYFTFCGNSPLHDRYVMFEGTYEEARKQMFEVFGDKWAFQYSRDDFIPQIIKFGLKVL